MEVKCKGWTKTSKCKHKDITEQVIILISYQVAFQVKGTLEGKGEQCVIIKSYIKEVPPTDMTRHMCLIQSL